MPTCQAAVCIDFYPTHANNHWCIATVCIPPMSGLGHPISSFLIRTDTLRKQTDTEWLEIKADMRWKQTDTEWNDRDESRQKQNEMTEMKADRLRMRWKQTNRMRQTHVMTDTKEMSEQACVEILGELTHHTSSPFPKLLLVPPANNTLQQQHTDHHSIAMAQIVHAHSVLNRACRNHGQSDWVYQQYFLSISTLSLPG